MMGSKSPHQRMIIATVLAGVVVLAALWMLALSPKRSESAEVRASVAAQEQRLSQAKAQLAGYRSAREQYPGLLAELRRVDEAVPARGAISSLLRQLQRRARVENSELQVAALKPAGAVAAPAPVPAAGAATATLTPGAAVAAGGVAILPFTFTYRGRYFDLVDVLRAARRTVAVESGDLRIDGRLVTIEGIAFQRAGAEAADITATVSATAYIAAAPVAPVPPATPVPAAPAAGTTQGG